MTLGNWETNSINHTDLFTLCDGLPDASVDMILCDLPYGTTAIAAREEGRQFICGDTSAEYVEIATKRLAGPYTLNMFNALAADDAVPEFDLQREETL